MTSANTLLKNILGVKGAVVQGADFSEDARGVKKLTIRMRPKKRESDRCPICGRHCAVYVVVKLFCNTYGLIIRYSSPCLKWCLISIV